MYAFNKRGSPAANAASRRANRDSGENMAAYHAIYPIPPQFLQLGVQTVAISYENELGNLRTFITC